MPGINKIKPRLQFLLTASIMLYSGIAFANVKLPAIFSDGMVLQQKSTVSIWGWADAGEKIEIVGGWGNDKPVIIYTNATGNWKTVLPTPKAGGPYTVKIKGKNSIELKDVLIGEVWIASGQSNMGFTLKSDADAKTEIPKAGFPHIRYFSVERQYGLGKFTDAPGSIWKKATPETVPNFSAVAYYFAKKIQKEKNVPVGIIFSAWGGTPAEAWTPREVLNGDSILSQYIDRWKFIQDNVGKDSIAYNTEVSKWENDKSLKKPEEPQTLYYFKRPWREPSVLFNGMIGPTIPYAIKGVIWYQGESNVGYASEYYHLFTKMIDSWRKAWGQENLPFYFVQLAPNGYSNMYAAAIVRDAQYQTMLTIPNTGMAVTTDVGNMENIHPIHKKEVGDRLALIALSKDYGFKKINYKGPELKKMIAKKGILEIKFNTTSGLRANGNILGGFEIGFVLPGTDSITYKNATAFIKGNKVIVANEDVKHPVAVRYGWLLIGEANLSDKDGLPAFPFQKRLNSK